MTRKNLAKILYALMLLSALGVFVFAKTATGKGEVGVILHGAFVVIGLYIVAALALVTLVTGWQIKFIRYSILGIAGLIAGMFAINYGTAYYREQQGEKRQADYNRDQDVTKGILDAHRPRYLAFRSNPQGVSSLLDEIEEKLKLEGIDPDCRGGHGCRRPLDYVKFKGSAYLYLGIFVDEKFLESIRDDLNFVHFYTDFYEENARAFTEEIHFSRLFDAMIEKSDHPDWLHGNTQNLLSKTLAERGYIETYLRFIPLTPPEFSETYWVQNQVLSGALTLAEKTGDDRAIIAAINHSIYNYPGAGLPAS